MSTECEIVEIRAMTVDGHGGSDGNNRVTATIETEVAPAVLTVAPTFSILPTAKGASTPVVVLAPAPTTLSSATNAPIAVDPTDSAVLGLKQEKQSQQQQSGKMDDYDSLSNFKMMYVLLQLIGLTMIVLMGSWIGVHLGGLAGTDNPKVEFNWHPLLMTIGMIFLYGMYVVLEPIAILIYRGFRSTRKKTLKLAHASIHLAVFVLSVIALVTVFDSHNLVDQPIPNMYTLHSWLGLSAVILFCLQYVAGFMAYLVPSMRESYKVAYMPLHIYFGLFGFGLAIASALMGLTEKALWAVQSYELLPSSGVMVNMCGMLFVTFGGLVIYLATEPSYKRKPIPEDTGLLASGNE